MFSFNLDSFIRTNRLSFCACLASILATCRMLLQLFQIQFGTLHQRDRPKKICPNSQQIVNVHINSMCVQYKTYLSLFEINSSHRIIRFGLQSIVTKNRQIVIITILLLQTILIYVCIVVIVFQYRRGLPQLLEIQYFFRTTLYLLGDIVLFFSCPCLMQHVQSFDIQS